MAGLDALDGMSAWVAWDDEGGRKVPKSSGGNARSNDPSTWLTRDEAEELAREKGYSGVGIMLSDGLTGIDLDGCVHDGEVDPWARDIIDRIGSYAEISPSGTGVHILCRADPSEVGAVGRADHSRGIEVYNHGRYFTVTGDRVNSAGIEDRTAELGAFVSEAFPGESPEESLAKAAGRLVRDQVARRANETVMLNVWRDKAHGARFARVPMGAEACGFCTMLAGRGFVYHSERTAGEFSHFHRSCRCKVVPGFPELEFYYENGTKVSRGRDPSVEGYDPDRYYDIWEHPEKYEAKNDKPDVKHVGAPLESYGERHTVKWTEAKERYVSNLEVAASRRYKEAVSRLFGDKLAVMAYRDIYHTLKVRSGTFFESLYAYDLTNGERISSVTDCNVPYAVYPSDEMKAGVDEAVKAGHDVVTLHNHPGNSIPSAADIVSIAKNGARFGVIACHDGSIIKYSLLDSRYNDYDERSTEVFQSSLDFAYASRVARRKSEEVILEAIGREYGVRIERIFKSSR